MGEKIYIFDLLNWILVCFSFGMSAHMRVPKCSYWVKCSICHKGANYFHLNSCTKYVKDCWYPYFLVTRIESTGLCCYYFQDMTTKVALKFLFKKFIFLTYLSISAGITHDFLREERALIYPPFTVLQVGLIFYITDHETHHNTHQSSYSNDKYSSVYNRTSCASPSAKSYSSYQLGNTFKYSIAQPNLSVISACEEKCSPSTLYS